MAVAADNPTHAHLLNYLGADHTTMCARHIIMFSWSCCPNPKHQTTAAHLLAYLGAVGALAAHARRLHLAQPLRLAQCVWRLRPGAQLDAIQLAPRRRLQRDEQRRQ
jgi:hypothetical protein